jgi:hypothetical protein
MQVDELKRLWDADRGIEVGAMIYEALPNDLRPAWAADILDLCQRQLSPVPAIEAVVAIARDAGRWAEGHAAFSQVRELTLEEEQSHRNGKAYKCLLYVAENAAKVVYNASGRPAPFDHDAGYWLVGCFRQFVKQVGSEEFQEQAWHLLHGWWCRTQDVGKP